MDLVALTRTWRRRWRLLAALMLLGLLVGLLSLRSGPQESEVSYYSATDTILLRPGASDIRQVAAFVTDGDVPRRVADRLGGSPAALSSLIQVTPRPDVGLLQITAIEVEPTRAAVLADTFADELIRFQADLANRKRDEALGPLQTDYDAQVRSYAAAQQQATATGRTADLATVATLERLKKSLADLTTRIQSVRSQAAVDGGLTTTHSAQVVPISSRTVAALFVDRWNLSDATKPPPTLQSLQAPPAEPLGTPFGRGFAGATFGLLVALGVAVIVDHLDPRVRSRFDAEWAFGWPVVTEIPALSRRQRHHTDVITLDASRSPAAEAFRSLRTSLLRQEVAGDGRVILVTSPGPSEGKTTTVSNLAVVLAETGRSVLVVDCDFRRPRVRAYLGRDEEVRPGELDPLHNVAFTMLDPDEITDASPEVILASQRELVRRARTSYDVVLLDTAPILTTNDAGEILDLADQILLLARAGHTTKEAADLAGEQLERRVSPPVTAALIGVTRATRSHVFGPGRRRSSIRFATDVATEPPDDVAEPDVAAGVEGEPAADREPVLVGATIAAPPSSVRRRPSARPARQPGSAAAVRHDSSGSMVGLVAAALGIVVVLAYAYRFTDSVTPTVGAVAVLPLVFAGAALLIRRIAPIPGRDVRSIVVCGLMLRLIGGFVRLQYPADAAIYHEQGVRLAASFRQFQFGVDTGRDLIGTGFIRYLSGLVHVVVFDDMSAAFMVWTFCSFAGCVLMYKAFVLAMPDGRHYRYAVLLFLWPSLSYWPDSIGKEGWMLLGIGLVSYGAAKVFVGRRLSGVAYLAAGLAAATMVRPHVALAMFLALSVALLLRRSGRPGVATIFKVFGMVLLLVIGGFLANKTASVLSHDETIDTGGNALDSATSALDATTDRTTQGDSAFQATVVRTPLDLPKAMVTVLFRPFPNEAHDINGLMTAVESLALVGLLIADYRQIFRLPKLMRESPYVTYVLVYTLLFVYAFSSIGNFGILARQRTQLTPLLLVLVALPPIVERARKRSSAPARTADAPVERAARGRAPDDERVPA